MSLSLEQGSALFRLLADPSRMRLLLLLEQHALSGAELTQITDLAQSRVSTHLARLAKANLVQARREGGGTLYAVREDTRNDVAGSLWNQLRSQVDDVQVRADRERATEVIRARKRDQTWAESVAGRMERHYSPGRSWEATARALVGLSRLGDVLDLACGDGVLSELLAPHARSITAADVSPTLIAAARGRLKEFSNVRVLEADMHALPLEAKSFDLVFLMHALSYTRKPQVVIGEAARVLKPGGRLVVAALNAHTHKATTETYDHVNLGLSPAALRKLLEGANLKVEQCEISSREDRPPYFEVVTAFAVR